MKYQLVLSSYEPVLTPNPRNEYRIRTAPQAVLDQARSLAQSPDKGNILAGYLEQAIRVYYHTDIGYVGLYFIRVNPVRCQRRDNQACIDHFQA